MEQHSKFVKVSIYILAALIAGLIGLGFALGEPKFHLSAEIISLVLILVILFLSESFNNLSIGKLFSLSRENKKKTEENESLRGENIELRNQLISIATNVNQSQVTFNGLSPDMLRALNVVPADEGEKEAKEKFEAATQEDTQARSNRSQEQENLSEFQELFKNVSSRLSIMRWLEPEAISKFGTSIGIDPKKIRHEVRFASAFEGLDPIMENPVVFDAYYQLEEKELFFEVMRADFLRPDRFYYLYQMLTKLYLYRKAKGTRSELIVVLVNLPESIRPRRGWSERGLEKLKSQFAPAIANKLLRIEFVEYSEEQLMGIYKEQSSNK